MTDRQQAGLRGRVHICSSVRDHIYPEHTWMVSRDEMFTADGRLLQQRHRNRNGSGWFLVFHFDDRLAKLLEKERRSDDPSERQRFTYLYDDKDRLERILLHSEDEQERVFESVRYEADGTKAVTRYPVPLDDATRQKTAVCADSALHLSLDAAAIMTIFDAGNRAVRKVLYDSGDKVIRRIGFRYDSRGLLLEEGELVGGAIRPDFRNTNRYDDAGNCIETERKWGDLGGSHHTFTYNSHGDVETEVHNQATSIGADDGPMVWTHRFVYQYDRRGNWTERRTEIVSGDGDIRTATVEHRELEYF